MGWGLWGRSIAMSSGSGGSQSARSTSFQQMLTPIEEELATQKARYDAELEAQRTQLSVAKTQLSAQQDQMAKLMEMYQSLLPRGPGSGSS